MAAIHFCIGILVSVAGRGSTTQTVRLANGTDRSGIVELYQAALNLWWPVCGKECWSDKNSNVTCKELGLRGGEVTEELSYFANLDTVQYKCNGTENALQDCKTGSCRINGACSVIVRVTCDGTVRLNGYQTFNGRKRVEVFRENQNGDFEWKGLCRYGWTQENTDVVCKQYGFRTGKSKAGGIENSSKEKWDGIEFNCSGVEDHLSFCHTVSGNRSCDSDVIVTCSNPGRYNETCSEKAPCEDGLSCTKYICKCGNEMESYWSTERKKCLYQSSVAGSCRSDDDCISNLVCQGTGNRQCKCGTDGEFWDSKENKCQQSTMRCFLKFT